MVAFNPVGDFASVVDGLEAVTLYRRGTSTTVAITKALNRPVGASRRHRSDVDATDGKVLIGEKTWHIPIAECATKPAVGDWITDSASEQWTILEVTRATLGDRWQCSTINLAVAYQLDCWVAIEKATYSKTTAGAATETWTTWRSGIRAKIVTDLVEVTTADMARTVEKRYTIYLGEDVSLDQTHRIRGPDGTYYRIVSYTGATDLRQLQTVDAEEW